MLNDFARFVAQIFGEVFDKMFDQIFDQSSGQVFDQGFGIPKTQCAVLLGWINTVYCSCRPEQNQGNYKQITNPNKTPRYPTEAPH